MRSTGSKIGVGFILIIIVFVSIIFGAIMGIPGCRNQFKHIQSSVIGLNRTCTVYSIDGTEIRKFEGKFKIEESAGYKTKFTLDDGRTIYISGGITIIEEK